MDIDYTIRLPAKTIVTGLAGTWTIVVLASLIQLYAGYVFIDGAELDYGFWVLWSTFGVWLPWVIASPLIFKLNKLFPIYSARGIIHFGMHLFASLLLSCFHILLLSALTQLGYIEFEPLPFSIWDHYQHFLSGTQMLLIDMLLYWFLIGAMYILNYFQKYQQQTIRHTELKASLDRSRLDVLRMQIRPHFLFNTLNSMSTLVLKKDNDRALEMIKHLSDFLRLTLVNFDSDEIPLHEEMNYLMQYLAIEKIRFEDRLQVTVDVPTQLDYCLVPSLILQPLMENAIKHGISRLRSGGCVALTIHENENCLKIRIVNDGTGLGNNVQPGGQYDCDEGAGVGLDNTKHRLSQLYGDAQSISLSELDEGAVEMLITLPKTTSPLSKKQ